MSAFYSKGEGTVYSTGSVATVSSSADGPSIALPAGLLANAGDYLLVDAFYALSGLNGNVVLSFGTDTIRTTTYAVTSPTIRESVIITRTGAATQEASVISLGDTINAALALVSPTQTLANSITLKYAITGWAAGSVAFRSFVVRVGRAS